MALEQKYNHESGLIVDAAYYKVGNISGNKEYLHVTCEIYLSKEAADSGKAMLGHIPQAFKPSVEIGAQNFIAQSYDYLKTLPEFKAAKDC